MWDNRDGRHRKGAEKETHMESLWSLSFPWVHFLLRGALIYLAVLLLIRIAGKRQVGQMGTGEFVAILLISNAVQNAMNGGDNSITGGLVLAAVIVLLSVGIAYLTYKSKKIETLLQGQPRLLIHQGKIIPEALEKEWLNSHELKTMLRRQGISTLADIQDAILESDGSISIIRKEDLKIPLQS